MFCLNCDNIVISGPLKSHCYIGNTLDMCVDETHNCRAHITEETVNKICIWKHLQHVKHCKRFEPRSRFISRLSMIVWVNTVLNRTVVVDNE